MQVLGGFYNESMDPICCFTPKRRVKENSLYKSAPKNLQIGNDYDYTLIYKVSVNL